jgi:hypothetical protein
MCWWAKILEKKSLKDKENTNKLAFDFITTTIIKILEKQKIFTQIYIFVEGIITDHPRHKAMKQLSFLLPFHLNVVNLSN